MAGWRRDDAISICRAALARAPDELAVWNLLGEILQASDAPAAERAWREALRRDPGDPEALFHLGNRHRERGEFDAAISHYERALLRAPRHPGMLNNLALALEAAGQPERAQTCYQQAVQAQPGHADGSPTSLAFAPPASPPRSGGALCPSHRSAQRFFGRILERARYKPGRDRRAGGSRGELPGSGATATGARADSHGHRLGVRNPGQV